MKPVIIKTAFRTAAALCVLALSGQQAQAGTLHNGWNYSIDSFKDGTENRVIGDKSQFEFYGMAYTQTRDKVVFAINSNLSPEGYKHDSALNGKISYGDMFLNFANPKNFNSANGSLYGIRFDDQNDTRFVTGTGKKQKVTNPGVGLYEKVSTTSVATKNSGYSSLNQHTATVNNVLKGQASYGDMASDTSYFDNTKAAATSMASGNFLGAIAKVADFSKLGLDFGHFQAKGTYTFGFSVDKKYLPNGSFIANLFAECGNDGMVLSGDLKDIPEPSMMIGLATIGLLTAGGRLRRRELKGSAIS